MPIEIKELHIKINVNDSDQTNASQDKKSIAIESNLIEMCLEQINQIDKRKKER